MKHKLFFLFIVNSFAGFAYGQNIAVNTSGTAAAAANMFEVTQTSTAANMVAVYAINSGTGDGSIGLYVTHSGAVAATKTGYGLQAIKTGASAGNNVAGFFSASGGAFNYALIVPGGGGYVGIGISNPAQMLHIRDGALLNDFANGTESSLLFGGQLELFRSTTAIVPDVNGYVDFKDNAADDYDFRVDYNHTYGTNGGLEFVSTTNGQAGTLANRMTILNSNGYVGIGTTAPNALLTVGAPMTTTNLSPEAIVNTSGTKPFVVGDGNNGIMIGYAGNDIQARTTPTFGNNGNLILNQYGGNVGIGLTNPTAKLQVAGGILRTNTRVSSNQIYPLGHSGDLLCIDPTWSNAELQAYLNSTNVQWYNDASAPAGYCIQVTGSVNVGGAYNSGVPYIAIDQNSSYYMECWIKSSPASAHYMGSIEYDENLANPSGNPGAYGYWVMSNYATGAGWVKVSATISGFGAAVGQFQVGKKYWTPQALFNYGFPGSTCYISGWRVVELKSTSVAPNSGNYIQNQTAADQAAGFRINGNGLFNGGSVGIGTTSPGTLLEVKGTGASLMRLTASSGRANLLLTGDVGNTDGPQILFQKQNVTEFAIYDYNGAPKLTIWDAATNNDAFSIMGGKTTIGNGSGISGNSSLNVYGNTSIGTTYIGTAAPANGMIVEGNVGIGVLAPGRALEVVGSGVGQHTAMFKNTGLYGIALGACNTQTYGSIQGISTALGTNTNMVLQESGGNVGIANTNPGYKLHVGGDIYANGGWLRVSGNQGLYWETWGGGFYMQDGSWIRGYNGKSLWMASGLLGGDGGLTIGYGGASPTAGGAIIAGNVGIGTSTPGYSLDVAGTTSTCNLRYSSYLGACSDVRYKKNILPLHNALANVLKIQGVNYFWKTNEYPEKQFSNEKQIGFIAQEIEKIYPELVITDKDGYKSVDYSRLTPILVEALKDQQNMIEGLTKKVEALENSLKAAGIPVNSSLSGQLTTEKK